MKKTTTTTQANRKNSEHIVAYFKGKIVTMTTKSKHMQKQVKYEKEEK